MTARRSSGPSWLAGPRVVLGWYRPLAHRAGRQYAGPREPFDPTHRPATVPEYAGHIGAQAEQVLEGLRGLGA